MSILMANTTIRHKSTVRITRMAMTAITPAMTPAPRQQIHAPHTSTNRYHSSQPQHHHKQRKQHPQSIPTINLCLIGPPGSGKGTYGKLLSQTFGCPLIVAGDVLREEAQSQTTDVGRHVAACQRAGKLVEDSLVASVILSHLFRLERQGRDGAEDGDEAGDGDDDSDNRNNIQNENDNPTNQNHNHHLQRHNPTLRIGYILDGFPRSLQQAQLVHHGQSPESPPWPHHLQLHAAIHLDVPETVCQEKMMGRRLCLRCNKSWNVANVSSDGFVLPPTLPTTASLEISSSLASLGCRDCKGEPSWVRREDDTVDIFQKRMEEYRLATEPVLDYFRGRDCPVVPGDDMGVGAGSDGSRGCDKGGNGSALIRFVPFRGVQDMPLLEQLIWDRFVLTTEEGVLDSSSRCSQE